MPGITEAREVQKLELAAEILGSTGIIHLRALGTSMLPAIWPGDVVSIERVAANEVGPGDIVLVARDGRFFVHRVIEKRDCQWITRGDSLPQIDPPVTETKILGKVSRVRRRNRTIVPKPRLSFHGRMLASLFCWSNLLRNFALRVHSLWSSAAFEVCLAPWPLRSRLRAQDTFATVGRTPGLHES